MIKMLKALFGSKKPVPVKEQPLVAANDNVEIDWNDYVSEYKEEELVRDPYDGEMLTKQEFHNIYGHVTTCGCESVQIGYFA